MKRARVPSWEITVDLTISDLGCFVFGMAQTRPKTYELRALAVA